MLHGREGGKISKRSRHMCSVPWTTTVTTTFHSNGSSPNHFVKDGRKISVGDCALFKSAQDSPPFIGLIRSLTSDKENILRLGLNWLYRPAEVILEKGVALEAAPNEVFYSFHSDEIPAASLLHPCKVAFLPQGVELLPGVFSFVCRRVYDIKNRSLRWLMDQDYFDDHQGEVDQLLHKTRIDMHATAQQPQGARSPKSVNGSSVMSPLKSSPDSMQNSSSNIFSQTRGRKRERGAQSSEPSKRERSVRTDGEDSAQLRSESMLKLEIAQIAEKGGLVDSEAVERLVQLIQPEKKIDLSGRCSLARIIAATDKVDCLSLFVQLSGLHVLDEWLQEVHKRKIGDPENIKDGDKSMEDFLLVLLRALDKLPVNLHALQKCNIGKSVNHLRSHKNSEIQKKARSLVDRWKKRVEAEISINDAKSGSSQGVSWPGRSRCDSPHGGNKHSNGSSDAAIRSPVTPHSSLKSASVKLVHGDSTLKSPSAFQGGARSAQSPASTAGCLKVGQPRISTNGVGSELPQAAVKDEKCSSSSQSHTNSQCSSEHTKHTVPSGKEDAKSSTAVSRRLNKLSGSGSKHRKSANGLQGAENSGLEREAVPNRCTSTSRISAAEKVSHHATDSSIHEGTNHKLIVKIPNRGRGSAQGVLGGSGEDICCGSSKAFSPALSEKHDLSDVSLSGKHDALQSNEVDGLSSGAQCRTSIENKELPSVTKVSHLPFRNEMKSRKAHDSAFSSMNALVESCVKFSESNASLSAGDDTGMNLLASVAAGEISTSGMVSPATSACRNSAAPETFCSSHHGNKKQDHTDEFMMQQCPVSNTLDAHKQNVADVPKVNYIENSKLAGLENPHRREEGCLKSSWKMDEQVHAPSIGTNQKRVDDGSTEILSGKSSHTDESSNHFSVVSQSGSCAAEDQVKDEPLNEESKKTLRDTVMGPSSYVIDEKNNVTQQLQSGISMERNSHAATSECEATDANEKATIVSSSSGHDSKTGNLNEGKFKKADGANVGEFARRESKRADQEKNASPTSLKQEEYAVSSTDKDQKASCRDKNKVDKEACVHQSSNAAMQETTCKVALLETKVHLRPKGSSLTIVEDEAKGDGGSAKAKASLSFVAAVSTDAKKLGFDLNEGLSVDDGKSSDPVQADACPHTDTFCSLSPMQIPASITVASAAKGAFVPPKDLLRNKKELGWKGSAATSAFRPAEPRKVMEVSLGLSRGPLPDIPACKQGRPPLDFDLNVADERTLLDIGCQGSGEDSSLKKKTMHELTTTASLRCSGGLDLDLNEVDEASDVGHSGQRVEVSNPPIKTSLSSIFVNGKASSRRDFDLNDGPAIEEIHVDQASYNQHSRGSISFQPPYGPRINGSAAGNCLAWYPSGTSYSVSMTPSSMPEKENFPVTGIGSGGQRVIGGPTSSLSFNHDDYKGSVLSSTPAMPFHPGHFQYPVFPFGTSFRLPSSAFPGGPPAYIDTAGRISAIPSQSAGTTAGVPFQYPQPYVVSRQIPDVTNSGMVENTQKWGKQGLDLNSGPGGLDIEGRNESLPTVSRQLPAISPQSLGEEQARMYNLAGGVLKRKEPEGGWNMDKLNFRPSSWQ